jgi:hypothetical protein
MDIDRIAVVLHTAVLTKLQNEARIPETLTQEQAQASYDRVYDIIQDTINGRDIHTNKIEIQKEATLRSIQEIPLAIRDASKPLTPIKETPDDIQNLVEQELQKRGMQDQSIGATPPPPPSNPTNTITPTPTPTNTTIGSEQQTTPMTEPVPQEYTPNDSQGASASASNTQPPPMIRQYTPRPPSTSPPPLEPVTGPVSTLITSPEKGTDGLRWEFTTESNVLGITQVHIPHMFVNQYPYLLITITNNDTITTMTHPLIHKIGNWYDIPNGEKCMGNLSGSFRITITDPDGDIIPTRFTLKEAQENHTLYTKAVIHPDSGIAYSFEDTQTNKKEPDHETEGDTKEDTEQETKEESKMTPDDDVILLFEDHSIGVFFLTSAQ